MFILFYGVDIRVGFLDGYKSWFCSIAIRVGLLDGYMSWFCSIAIRDGFLDGYTRRLSLYLNLNKGLPSISSSTSEMGAITIFSAAKYPFSSYSFCIGAGGRARCTGRSLLIQSHLFVISRRGGRFMYRLFAKGD
jgi:hypothetical protein